MMTTIRITTTTVFLLIGLNLFAANTNKPIVEFKEKSARISSEGKRPGWEAGFKAKFKENIQHIVSQLNSDLVDVKMEGESGGKANFEVGISVVLMYDCDPCTGEKAIHEESLFISLTFIDARTNKIVRKFKPDDQTNIINGETTVQETIDRTWSLFLLKFIKERELKNIIKDATDVSDATLTFRAKNGSDPLPLKADGKKKGVLKIEQINSGDKRYPVGENSNNPLTEFELSCENGNLIDKDGAETKKIKFTGDEFPVQPGFLEFDYVVYNCDEQCEKYDNFSLKLKSQNGTDLTREIKKRKEEFECYGYTLSLEYTETNDLTGTTKIMATWECFQVNFGNPGEKPAEMDASSLGSGQAFDTNGDPLLPPYTIPLGTENGQIHVSAPKRNNPVSFNFSSTGGPWAEIAGTFHVNFDEDFLTNPPELIWVKSPMPSGELCAGIVPSGVYLEWQFDVWGNLPDLGDSQLYQPAARICPLFSNVPNSTTARVPESAIAAMKEGKAFTFTNSNDFGTYTITGIPQQQ